MEKIKQHMIINVFRNILNTNVRVLEIKDDEIDYAIYNSERYPIDSYPDDKLKTFGCEYAIAKTEENKWIYYTVAEYGGSYDEPPSVEEMESIKQYATFEKALKGLLDDIINTEFDMTIQDVEYAFFENEY